MYDIDLNELRHLNVDERRTLSAIASTYGCSCDVIKSRLDKLNILTDRGRRDRK